MEFDGGKDRRDSRKFGLLVRSSSIIHHVPERAHHFEHLVCVLGWDACNGRCVACCEIHSANPSEIADANAQPNPLIGDMQC